MQHELMDFSDEMAEFHPMDDPPPLKRRGRSSKARGKSAGRVCRSCGKDPYPNYFYCPPCHHRVSHLGMEEEHEEYHR